MKMTINVIAKKVGVSRSTVSRVLNNDPNVNPLTRKAVNEVVAQLDYQPSAIARGMVKGALPICLVIVGDILNQYFANAVRGIEQVLEEAGYMAVVYNSDYDVEKEKKFIQMAQNSNFAGIIPMTAIRTNELEECIASSKCPVVLIHRQLKNVDIDSIHTDDFRSGYMVTRHLISKGHTKIAHMSGPNYSSVSQQRKAGWQAAMTEAGLKVEEGLLFEGQLDKESSYKLAPQIFIRGDVTAIVANCFLMCLGIISAAKKRGIRIPEDMSLVCCESIQEDYCEISITAAGADQLSIGREAARVLLERIKKSNKPIQRIQFSPVLVDKGSAMAPNSRNTGQT